MSDSLVSSKFEENSTVSTAVDKFMKIKPELVAAEKKSKFKSLKELRSNLENTKYKGSKQRISARVDDCKQLGDCFRDLSTDMSNINTEFETLYQYVFGMMARLEDFENKLKKVSVTNLYSDKPAQIEGS